MNFEKNKFINETMDVYYETFLKTLDTGDYVPEKFFNKINLYIFKNMKSKFKEIDKFYKVYIKVKRIALKNSVNLFDKIYLHFKNKKYLGYFKNLEDFKK